MKLKLNVTKTNAKAQCQAKARCQECGADTVLSYPEGNAQCLTCEDENTPTARHMAMSAQMGDLLANQVVPRLRALVRTVPKVGSEDDEEIVQDATLMAARMMVSADAAGHPITAGNASFYATKAARSGRRSYYTGRSDVMHPGCQLDGNARFDWLDCEVEFETGDVGTLHDVITSHAYQGQECDPSEEAARNLDWQAFLANSPERYRIAVDVLLSGGTMREAGKRCGIGDSAALMLKRRIGADLLEFFGEDVIRRLLNGVAPTWESDLRMSRERGHQNHEDSFRPQP